MAGVGAAESGRLRWGGGAVHVGVGGLSLFAFGTQTVQSMQIDKQ